MAETKVEQTSTTGPADPLVAEIKTEQNTPPPNAAQACASKNCIHKPKSADEVEKEKKTKKKKTQKKKYESDSDSSDSDDSESSDSSDSDEDNSDTCSSSSSDDDSRKKKKSKSSKARFGSKKNKDSKKSKSKSKSKPEKTRTSRQVKYETEDDSSNSSEGSSDDSSSIDTSTLVKHKSWLKSSKGRGKLLKELLKRASKKDLDDDGRSSRSSRSSKSQKSKSNKKGKESTKPSSSKLKYKRLDEIWDEILYDYRLKETSDKKKADEWDKYVFTVRRKFDIENHYVNTVVDIRSKYLIDCLKIVMEDVQGVSLVEKTPKLMPNMLFLYLEDFREYIGVLKNAIKECEEKKIKKSLKLKVKHLQILIGYLDKDYDEIKRTLDPMLANGTITFDLLWALYKPHTLVYKSTYEDESQPRAFKIDYAGKEIHYAKGLYYSVEGFCFDYDGEHFGSSYIDAEVFHFQGARKITSLPCYPLKYHQNEAELKTKLVDRGKKFLSLCGMNYRSCDGICYVKKDNQCLKVSTNGRVMVDPKTFRRINPNYLLGEVDSRDVEDENIECRCDKKDQPRKAKSGPGKLYMIKTKADKEVEVIEIESTDERAPQNITDSVKRAEAAKVTFTEEELLIANPLLPGFCFSEKLWVELPVSGISDVPWDSAAFDSLVIPEQHKSIVRALVSVHGKHASKSIDDVITGKGQGLVAVLHGKPGLGKTLTCEAVADLLKRPLYSVSAGDLGHSTSGLEYQLQVILDVAHTWGAVLLLDEADVFLEERSSHDVGRNGLVSIFLRLLERFQGILFLTTNRVQTFDEAFVSRIHLSLRYGELTAPARKTIWKTFINKVADIVAETAAASSSATSDTSSAGMPTPETTISTPNSGAITPALLSDSTTTPSETLTTSSSSSIESIDSDKTITMQSTQQSNKNDSSTAATTTSEAEPVVAIEKFTEANYVELSRVELNGRQIKNLVKTAQALALYENVPMGMEHLRRCIDVGRSFEMDLKGGRGWEDVMRSYT